MQKTLQLVINYHTAKIIPLTLKKLYSQELFCLYIYSIYFQVCIYLAVQDLSCGIRDFLTAECDTWCIGKESACQCRRHRRCGFHPWSEKICWRRKWQPTPVFFPGKCNGQRRLADYNPQSHKELDMTEQTSTCDLLVEACGIQFLDQGLNLDPLHWKHGVLVIGPSGKSSSPVPTAPLPDFFIYRLALPW